MVAGGEISVFLFHPLPHSICKMRTGPATSLLL